jgi:hypothetical protein
MSLGAVAAALNQDGRPSPTEETCSRYVLRSMVLADLYMGTWWYNRQNVKRSGEAGAYTRKTKTTYKPKDQ